MAVKLSAILFAYFAIISVTTLLTEANPMKEKPTVDKNIKTSITDEMDTSPQSNDQEEDIKGAESAYSPYYFGYPYYSLYSPYSHLYKPYLHYPYHYPYLIGK